MRGKGGEGGVMEGCVGGYLVYEEEVLVSLVL